MATEQSQETVGILCVGDDGDALEVMEVKPIVAKIVRAYEKLGAEDRADMDVIARAMAAGRWHHTIEEIQQWTPEQHKAAVDAVRVPAGTEG